jgi:hypothetical protein
MATGTPSRDARAHGFTAGRVALLLPMRPGETRRDDVVGNVERPYIAARRGVR